LDHFFDDAPDPVDGNRIRTIIDLVPCSEDFLNQSTVKTTVQFLVFNEFEQRFSTSRRVNCFFFTELSNIDTRDLPSAAALANRGAQAVSDDQFSIFNIDVEGTLTGQTRIRPVQGTETNVGHGMIGVAFEVHEGKGTYTAAFQLDQAGLRDQGDIIRAPRQ